MITFTIPGQPVAKGRAIAKRRQGAGGKQYIAMMTPEKTANYENLVKLAATGAMHDLGPSAAPIYMTIELRMQIPASWSNRRRALAVAGEILPTKKPDADNILKAIKDGCNGIVWRDDAQVVRIGLGKVYADQPCAIVTVSESDRAAA